MERSAGRLMRAPDHDEADTGTVLTDQVDEPADEKTDDKVDEKVDDKKDDVQTDDKVDEKVDDKKDEPKNEFLGAPEGDYEITGLPEGVEVDKAVVDALAPVAKEIGLSDVAMSKLAGVYNDKVLPHLTGAITKGIEDQVVATRKEWHQETKAAVEGGTDAEGKKIEPLKDDAGNAIYDGRSLKEVQQVAAKTLDRFGTPELRTFLEASGLGNHEALVRFAYTVGKAISEDKFPRSTAKGKASREELYYGSSAS